jgi:hypothetical protein
MGHLIAIGYPHDSKGAARESPWGAERLYVDDAHWYETLTALARDADRIVLCIDASDGVRWEIAHVLQSGHANKTLFFLNPLPRRRDSLTAVDGEFWFFRRRSSICQG